MEVGGVVVNFYDGIYQAHIISASLTKKIIYLTVNAIYISLGGLTYDITQIQITQYNQIYAVRDNFNINVKLDLVKFL